jgi:trehalose-phosphatase
VSAPLARGPAARRLVAALATATRPLLLLDLDGTLAPLREHHGSARVPRSTRQLLARLRRTGAAVVIVSGRSIVAVQRIARTTVDAILGDHGARLWQDGRIRHWLPGNVGRIRKAVALVHRTNATAPGVFAEEKDRSLAVHLRVSREDAVVRRLTRELRALGLRVLHGHRVLDVQLPGVHKGAAVRRWLALHPGFDAVVYAGDDTTDRDAFRALAGRGATIAVGRRVAGAAFRTRDPRSLAVWLSRLASARERR